MAYLTPDPISVGEWNDLAVDRRDGASVEFLGIVRGHEGNRAIAYLEYEAYEPMAERLITQFVEEAKTRWPLHQVYARHRLGRVAVGEIAVLIGVQAPHRVEAFEACQFLIEAIKQDVPIWKTAVCADSSVVETTCTDGHQTR